ncbi:MAG: DUF2306 domain-containing protein [Agitococcus sp.]|nr:DUF2306 domain-containing protein [Agitococcus sp.]
MNYSAYKPKITRAAWLVIALFSVIYAPMAVEYFVHYFTPNTPNLWLTFFTWVAGAKHTMGAGSTELIQHVVYTKHRIPMLFHAAAGGIAILLCTLQFYAPFRKKYPQIHRAIGKVFFTIVLISMTGSITFLIKTDVNNSFNGLAFYSQLWLLALGTLTSAILGVIAISQGQRKMHQAAMIYCFALLLSAPVLRIEWLFIAQLFEGITQVVSNLFSALIFGFLVVPCAIAATRLTDYRKPVTLPESFHIYKTAYIIVAVLSVIAVVMSVLKYMTSVGGITGFTVCLITVAVGTFACYVAAYLASLRANNGIAIKEWRIHILAYLAAPIVFLAFWEALSGFADNSYEAFKAASYTAPATAFTMGYFWMALSRRVKISGKLSL